jgi:thiamine biosynthesis lipoprotein
MKSEAKIEFKALGTDINAEIVFSGNGEKKGALSDLNAVKRLFEEKQKIFDRFSGDSELNSFNLNLGSFREASPDFSHLAGRAIHYHALSGGLYDPRIIGILEAVGYSENFKNFDKERVTVNNDFVKKIEGTLSEDLLIDGTRVCLIKRMDFSGIAKGYITDLAAKFLKGRGWKSFLVDSGGDMYAAGSGANGEKWRISIEGVAEKQLMLQISEKGIATSGVSRKKWEAGGKRYHHLINPRKPDEFSFELRTVSVIADDTENADGRAKVLVLMGKKEGLEFAKRENIAAIFLDYRGNVIITPEAKKYLDIQR